MYAHGSNNSATGESPASAVARGCSHGHHWITISACEDRCEICKLLTFMHKYDPRITSVQSQYVYGQQRFEFICGYGHHFIAEEKNCKKGCRSCNVLKIMRDKMCTNMVSLNDNCVYVDDDSRLRFHCCKYRHNPDCSNLECVWIREGSIVSNRGWAENCKDLVPCSQDFYATPRQIKHKHDTVLNCALNHAWTDRVEVHNILRVMEVIFDKRFDNVAHGVEFSALNIELGIAVTHLADKRAARCVENAAEWCTRTHTRFIIVDKDNVSSAKIIAAIARELHNWGYFPQKTPQMIVQSTKTCMNEMRLRGYLFKNMI